MKTRTFLAEVKGLSPFSPSKFIAATKEPNELHDDFERRIWRERVHADADGRAFIPAMMWKLGLDAAAKSLGEKVPGKGRAQYGSIFRSGIMVVENTILPVKKEDVPGEWLLLNADGKKGGGTRVQRCMPYITPWAAKVPFVILHDALSIPVFTRAMEHFGMFGGIGRFAPRAGGFHGRFEVIGVSEN